MGGGITLTLLVAVISSPAASSTLTISRWPLLAAEKRAVHPSFTYIADSTRRAENNSSESISNDGMCDMVWAEE